MLFLCPAEQNQVVKCTVEILTREMSCCYTETYEFGVLIFLVSDSTKYLSEQLLSSVSFGAACKSMS